MEYLIIDGYNIIHAGPSPTKPQTVLPCRDNSIMSRIDGEVLEKLEKMRRSKF